MLLAGAYPGDPDPVEHRHKVQAIVGAGVRVFVNLMEDGEIDHAGNPFVPYADLAQRLCRDVAYVRHPIRDVSVPTASQMRAVLATVDQSLESLNPVYVHCWGGVGRTGTVVGCWLLRHRLAHPSSVLAVLTRIRQQDRQRRHRMSPETLEQQKFVTQWLAVGEIDRDGA